MAARAAAAALAALVLVVPAASRAGSSARFAVAVRVVKPLLVRTPAVVLHPEARVSTASGPPASPTSTSGAAPPIPPTIVVTFLPDGAPAGIVER